MTILIDDPALDAELITKASAAGLSVEEYVLGAVRTRLMAAGRLESKPIDWESIARLQEKVAGLPVLDDRSLEEMLYDKDGMPN